ncbi:MAG TPA: AI-2E family transporter [Polyangiaceae bacterium]|nr:AI-2E family transporter [Polyangiaceae bacterium]
MSGPDERDSQPGADPRPSRSSAPPRGGSAAPWDPTPFKYGKHVFVAVCALAFVGIVLAGRAVLLPFLLAIVVGYVLFPAVTAVERRAKMPRWVAILLVYLVMLGGMAAFAIAVVPRLFEETKKLSAELPRITRTVRDEWLPVLDHKLATLTKNVSGSEPEDLAAPVPFVGPEQAPPAPIEVSPRADGGYDIRLREKLDLEKQDDDTWSLVPPGKRREQGESFSSERLVADAFDHAIAYAQKNAGELLVIGRVIIGSVSRGVFYFFITLMLAGYLMFTYEGIHEFAREMWPPYRRASFDRFLHRLDRSLAGVVRGQLLICLVNGVLSAIGFWIFGLNYWPILALIAGIMSIIPIFGSILSTIPAVAIGLTQDFSVAFWVLVWIIAIHQLEANFLNPKIIGDAAKIHPVLVVFALLVGEHLFQIAGALLAVPCLAVVQAVFLHFRESVLGIPASESILPPPPDPATATTIDATPPSLFPSDDDEPMTADQRTTYAVVTKASAVHGEDEPETEREESMRRRRRSKDRTAAVTSPKSRPKEVTTTLKSPD